ncbi:hypothetical protein AGMMS50229_02890 [Campylobacterota bacterium]|nr:hypothetical protein AGMMS50229_02890 [Campylobacterota bacterium]
MRLVFSFAVVLACLYAAPDSSQIDREQSYPKDVTAFVEQANDCEHWMGEEPYDEERLNEIIVAVEKLCEPLPKLYTALKDRYKNDKTIGDLLAKYNGFIDNIELSLSGLEYD